MKTTKEMISVMTAYEEGKKIKCLDMYGIERCVYDKSKGEEPAWDWAECDYRVCEEPKYRPYKDIDELLKDWAEKTHNVPANMEQLVRPLIWVKAKDTGTERLITDYNRQVELVNYITFDSLFKEYTFLDGSPCGKKE